MRDIPTEQVEPFVTQFFGLFSFEDLQLLNEILDLAGRVELPAVPLDTFSTADADGDETFTVLALTNDLGNPIAQAAWQGLIEDVRELARLRGSGGNAETLTLAAATTDPTVTARIEAMKTRLDILRSEGVRR